MELKISTRNVNIINVQIIIITIIINNKNKEKKYIYRKIYLNIFL